VRGEWVIRIDGKVKERTPDTVNPRPADRRDRGVCTEIEVLSSAKELPLPVFGEPDYPEDVRLKYRFLDLRRETLHANIMTRTKVISTCAKRMEAPASPNCDADPDRLVAGRRARLPGAEPHPPRQVLRAAAGAAAVQAASDGAGFDRYFQIAPCFRDEDPRADRCRASSTSSTSR
jgi:aspartyl-tRNA synthetase